MHQFGTPHDRSCDGVNWKSLRFDGSYESKDSRDINRWAFWAARWSLPWHQSLACCQSKTDSRNAEYRLVLSSDSEDRRTAPQAPGVRRPIQQHLNDSILQKEKVLDLLLSLGDEDIGWIITSAGSNRPALRSVLSNQENWTAEQNGYKSNFADAEKLDVRAMPNRYAAVDHDPTDVPTVQFKAPKYFVSEDVSHAQAQVLRVGPLGQPSHVRWATRDMSATSGKDYVATEGMLAFDIGESLKTIQVELLSDANWEPERQFAIHVLDEDAANAKVDADHSHAIVVVLDDDTFPTEKYSDEIRRDDFDAVPNFGLVIEYLKMQWSNPTIRCATIKIMLSDLLENLHFLAKALLQMYLVDCVLNSDMAESQLFFANRCDALAFVAAIIVVPHVLVHFLELSKPFGVGSISRKLLQTSLFQKCFSYSPGIEVADGDLVLSASRDTVEIVSKIYRGALNVLALSGRIVVICFTQLIAPVIFNREIHWFAIIPLGVLPVLMLVFLVARDRMSTATLYERLRMQDQFIGFVTGAVQSRDLIEEYNARNVFLDICDTRINSYHVARRHAKRVVINNRQFAEWLSILLVGFYTLVGGYLVIEGELLLGCYMTNLHLFQGMGRVYSDLYCHVLSIQEETPALKRLTRLMNVPTDLALRAELNEHQMDQSDAFAATLSKQAQQNVPLIDQLPIRIGDVTFKYDSVGKTDRDAAAAGCCLLSRIDGKACDSSHDIMHFQGQMTIFQGQLVQLMGPPSEGKTTLLKLIAKVILPKLAADIRNCKEPFYFIPTHLKVVYVASQPMFFSATLMENLTLGVNRKDSDGCMSRVSKICQRLGISETVRPLLESHHEETWTHHFGHTELALLCLARALIANPQLLCIERHFMGFSAKVTRLIMSLLREHVDSRGVELSTEGRRRPRTCVMTGSDRQCGELIDRIFNVSHAKGIEELPR